MTEHVEGRFAGASGGEIYWQGWVPDDDPSGVVVIAHGYAEHSGRYTYVAERLVAAGHAVYTLDIHGHGRSDGVRGNIKQMSEVCTDLDHVIKLVRERHTQVPLFLLGHSLGTLIALDYVTGRPVELAGLILSGSALATAAGSAVERFAAKVLSRVAPNLGVAAPIDAGLLSRDPAVISDYDDDPLNYRGKIRVRIGAEAFATIDRLTARLPEVRLPVLAMHGADDELNLPAGSQLIADKASSEDLTLKLYDGLRHEIFNEPEKESVLDDVVAWLAKHS